MKAIAFNGSPREGGNTEYLLNKVLEPIAEAGIETELVRIGGKHLHGCIACYKCRANKNSKCIIGEDMLNECVDKMAKADAIILGSPTYFAGMTSDMKAFIDRAGFVARSNGGLFSRKIGAAVVVHRRGGATSAFDSINHLFMMSRMIVPGSIYWNFGVGLEKEAVAKDEEALINMKDLGETIAWLIKKLK